MSIETTPLILLHGSGGTGATWNYQTRQFPMALAPTLPGHPDGPPLTSVEAMAAWLHEWAAEQAPERFVLAGHSLGGAIAQRYALDHPDRLAGLVLVGTGARLRVMSVLFDMLATDKQRAIEAIADSALARSPKPTYRRGLVKQMQPVSAETMAADFAACNVFDVMGEIDAITTPTLIICGIEDRLTPFKYSNYLHQQIANSRLELVPDAGHMVFIEQHRTFNAILGRFWNECAGA